jgi:hypothetical protein
MWYGLGMSDQTFVVDVPFGGQAGFMAALERLYLACESRHDCLPEDEVLVLRADLAGILAFIELAAMRSHESDVAGMN